MLHRACQLVPCLTLTQLLPRLRCPHVVAVLTGKAMLWFAHPVLGFFMYFPVAAAVLLLCWSHMDYDSDKGRQLLPYHVLGAALLNSLLATALNLLGAGMAMIFALWGTAAVLMALCLRRVSCTLCVVCCLGEGVLWQDVGWGFCCQHQDSVEMSPD